MSFIVVPGSRENKMRCTYWVFVRVMAVLNSRFCIMVRPLGFRDGITLVVVSTEKKNSLPSYQRNAAWPIRTTVVENITAQTATIGIYGCSVT